MGSLRRKGVKRDRIRKIGSPAWVRTRDFSFKGWRVTATLRGFGEEVQISENASLFILKSRHQAVKARECSQLWML